MSENRVDALQSKKNLKWLRSRIENFNDTVPYQIDALSSCKSNIRKQYRLENFAAVRQERTAAERTLRNLKQLQIDIDKLRDQVTDCDLNKFDALVHQSRQRISSALDSFNQYYDSLSLSSNNTIKHSNITFEDEDSMPQDKQSVVFAQLDEDKWFLENQLYTAQKVEEIEKDTQAINEIFCDLAQIINDQKSTVDHIEDTIEQSHADVKNATKELAQVAVKMNGVVYPLLGAVLGSCVGGPLGFLAGLKIGAVCAVSGSVIGFSGGSVLKNRQQKLQKEILENIQNKAAVS